ncbi:MAG TPA: helix-turn-helix transcriptional regulator [Candidatus Nitrosotenuis sp.]|jgi:transcriptional regulator with XRE-family HTH domain|nr:helix-turn-helix transcriptional regulator [Candidatus Nitrosotenuis sp.]
MIKDIKKIDQHVGQRLFQQRELLGWSRENLAHLIGISHQQIQNYEEGLKPIFVDHLYQLSEALSVPITFFYEGVDTQG